mmetsp:Transcript_2337/g.4822  ORF Transcript_2337/g.4822 Transcript_2337/m.4822 type:complete len:152 (+) Transcript_2337:714-1169(+)
MVIDPSGVYFRRESRTGDIHIAGKSPDENDDPDCKGDASEIVTDESFFLDNIWPVIAHRAPALESLKLQSSWAGFYEMNTFDANGIVGPHPLVPNLLLANGFSGHGIQQAPGVGRALTELVTTGRYQTIDLTRFSMQRILDNKPVLERNIV